MTRVVVTGPADAAAVAASHEPALSPQLAGVRGYASTAVEGLVEGLLDAGVGVDLVTLSPTVTAPLVLEGPRLSVYVGRYRAVGRARDAFRAERAELRRLLARTRGEVVHAHWTYEFAWAALSDPRPTVVTVHDAPLTILRHMPNPYRLVRLLMAYRVRLGEFAGVAVSPYVAGRWRRQMGDPRPLHVIPNVVVAQAAAAAPARGHRLVCVADDGELKNVRALLTALPAVRAACPGATLLLLGQGLGQGDKLARWAAGRGLDAGVVWCGRRGHGETLRAIEAADVVVHPSLEESFGMPLAEAMALGRPVVGGRRSGAVPWLLDGGSAGVLVDVRSPGELAAAVTALLADPARRARLGQAAAERIRSHFSPGAVVERHVELYERVLRGRAVPAPRGSRGGGR
jgi:glycosyltransferase involved in cell wall biosynthesis